MGNRIIDDEAAAADGVEDGLYASMQSGQEEIGTEERCRSGRLARRTAEQCTRAISGNWGGSVVSRTFGRARADWDRGAKAA